MQTVESRLATALQVTVWQVASCASPASWKYLRSCCAAPGQLMSATRPSGGNLRACAGHRTTIRSYSGSVRPAPSRMRL